MNKNTHKHFKILIILSSIISFIVFTHTLLVEEHRVFSQTEQFIVGMPFAGKWAYNSNVNPPYTDVNSSHPSVHKTDSIDKYHWATDLYAPPETPVKINIKNLSDGDTLTVSNISETSCGAGMRVRVTVKNTTGIEVGWIQYEHLETSLKPDTQISNNSVLGVTKNWTEIRGEQLSCYRAKDANGVHIHVAMNNSQGSYSCYIDHGNPGTLLSETENLGVLGSSNKGKKEKCSSLPIINTQTNNPGEGTQGTNSIPLSSSSEGNIQGASGQKVQNTISGENIQGPDSQNNSAFTNQKPKTQNNGLITSIVNFVKNIASFFKIKSTIITKSEPKVQDQPVEQSVGQNPTSSSATTETTKTVDENGCPLGDPLVEINNVQILGYYTQEEFETYSGDKELLLVVTGKLINPTSHNIKVDSVGLYRETDNTDFPPLLTLLTSKMELPKKSTIIDANSSVEFKSKYRVLWYTRYGILTKDLSPTLSYPITANNRPHKWWEWVDLPFDSEKCQPNYYEE